MSCGERSHEGELPAPGHGQYGRAVTAHGAHLRGIGASSISSAHDPRATRPSVVCLRTRRSAGGAYTGRLGSLPGTSSPPSCSWALRIPSAVALPVSCILEPASAGQKSRRTARCLRVRGGRTHDCRVPSTRSEYPRAVRVCMRAGSALKGRRVWW
jgi:hypothetical protein